MKDKVATKLLEKTIWLLDQLGDVPSANFHDVCQSVGRLIEAYDILVNADKPTESTDDDW